jgi:hypothetical protein
MYIGNQTALNGVNTASQVSLVNHKLKIIPLSLPRGAFLGLIRLNIWGLATLLSKKAFLVDAATTAKQTPPNMWWDVGGRWRNGWWNLGGDWDKFVSAVNAGKGKKALGFKLAPKQIKEKLKAQGIGGLNNYNNTGIGSVTAATLISAAEITIAFMPLILMLVNSIKKDLPVDSFEEINYVDEKGNPVSPPTGADDSTSSSMAGAGLIGLAALAAIYFGTMTKK